MINDIKGHKKQIAQSDIQTWRMMSINLPMTHVANEIECF